MKCEICNGTTVVRKSQRYQYRESGLNNVYLDSIDLLVCESCGDESPIIPRILDLHAAIGRAIALQQFSLRGEDIRFLRKQLGMRARQWAALLKISVETLSRWENNEQKVGPQSDALYRLMYLRIREELEGRFLSGDFVNQIAAVHPEQGDVPILLADVTTFKTMYFPSLEQMVSRYEGEIEPVRQEIHESTALHLIPPGRLQGIREYADPKPSNIEPASIRETEWYLEAVA